jgi:hypothetical protein
MPGPHDQRVFHKAKADIYTPCRIDFMVYRQHDDFTPILVSGLFEDSIQCDGRFGATNLNIADAKAIADKLGLVLELAELNAFTEIWEQDRSIEPMFSVA